MQVGPIQVLSLFQLYVSGNDLRFSLASNCGSKSGKTKFQERPWLDWLPTDKAPEGLPVPIQQVAAGSTFRTACSALGAFTSCVPWLTRPRKSPPLRLYRYLMLLYAAAVILALALADLPGTANLSPAARRQVVQHVSSPSAEVPDAVPQREEHNDIPVGGHVLNLDSVRRHKIGGSLQSWSFVAGVTSNLLADMHLFAAHGAVTVPFSGLSMITTCRANSVRVHADGVLHYRNGGGKHCARGMKRRMRPANLNLFGRSGKHSLGKSQQRPRRRVANRTEEIGGWTGM
ncbi:hypothetical protein C8R43DRAFT_963612 [Mycena crocata]|nr:hypothetical protein C8R43DRAFT_963612 [Mycena crocata]